MLCRSLRRTPGAVPSMIAIIPRRRPKSNRMKRIPPSTYSPSPLCALAGGGNPRTLSLLVVISIDYQV